MEKSDRHTLEKMRPAKLLPSAPQNGGSFFIPDVNKKLKDECTSTVLP